MNPSVALTDRTRRLSFISGLAFCGCNGELRRTGGLKEPFRELRETDPDCGRLASLASAGKWIRDRAEDAKISGTSLAEVSVESRWAIHQVTCNSVFKSFIVVSHVMSFGYRY